MKGFAKVGLATRYSEICRWISDASDANNRIDLGAAKTRCHLVDGQLKTVGIIEQRRDIPEHDTGNGKIWNRPDVIPDSLGLGHSLPLHTRQGGA